VRVDIVNGDFMGSSNITVQDSGYVNVQEMARDGRRASREPGLDRAATRLASLIAGGRREASLTQQQLADRAVISVGTVRDVEQGRTSQPRRDTVEALSLALGLDRNEVAEAAGWPAGDGHGPARAWPATAMVAGVWLGVLGPLAARRDGLPAGAVAGRQRAILGLLAVHPGRALHRETIIDAVWGSQPPASVVAMVQSHVSQLRRLLGLGVLTSDGTSYRLDLTATELDSLEFARLADEARKAAAAGKPAAACLLYEQALHLWRGEPLADALILRGHPAVTALAQQRAAVTLEHAAVAAAAGCPERAVTQLRELTAREPLDERAHARLMLTLTASGQQAAALSVFDRLRRRLDEELGISPGAQLAQVHLHILRGQIPGAASGWPAVNGAEQSRDTAHRRSAAGGVWGGRPPEASRVGTTADPPDLVPRLLPASTARFTGRASELSMLTGLLDQATAAAGTATICAISGMGGVGKTTLALHWAHRVTDAFPHGQLYVNLRGFGPSDGPAPPEEVLIGFLGALGVPPKRIPEGTPAQTGLLRSLLADRRLLVVLDNARDEEQVRPLLPASPGCLVIVTSRSQLAGLAAAEGASLLKLDVLTDAEAHALLAARLGSQRASAEPDAVTEIAVRCGRLPLALAAAAARAATCPHFPLASLAAELRDVRGRLDHLDSGDPAVSVRTVFSWSVRQLSPPAARMFRLLSRYPGSDVAVPAAASMAGTDQPGARRLLRELARCHLLAEPHPGRYALHGLLRAYAAEQAEAGPQADQDGSAGSVHSWMAV
jgi:DNA-binding SARP family transcriptional activator/DNA-binding transcriptional regulator YiaG